MADNVGEIFGAIIGIILIVGVVIPLIFSIPNAFGNDKQNEINNLNQQLANANIEISNRDIQIAELNSIINSNNQTISEKDFEIARLNGEITEKELVIDNLTEQLDYYSEKRYLQEITNNYYDIYNSFEKIENQFLPINISLTLFSLVSLALVIKVFGAHLLIKRLWKKIFKKGKKVPNLPPLDE